MPKETTKKRQPSVRIVQQLQIKKKKETNTQSSKFPDVIVAKETKPLPTRDPSDHTLIFSDFPHFRPNLTPKEILDFGSFGGTYFRPIYSSETGRNHENEWNDLPEEWFKSLPAKKYKASRYDDSVNKYGVSCGGDLYMWESNGWIRGIDPYGWFQWYCRFYLGRRCSDDSRQISRGLGVFGETGRWKRNLVNQCLDRVQNLKDEKQLLQVWKDHSISPKIRQLLQHWGYQITLQDIVCSARKR